MSKQSKSLPIHMSLATNRDDKGKTENYTIYNIPVQVQVKNKKGETVTKNAVLGGNGTIYIAHEIAGDDTEWVMMPKSMFDQLYTGMGAPAKQLGKPLPTAAMVTGATKKRR